MRIPEHLRAELDQTPEWWDRQYQALIRKRTPRAAAYHEKHEIVEERTLATATVRRFCAQCGIQIDPHEDRA